MKYFIKFALIGASITTAVLPAVHAEFSDEFRSKLKIVIKECLQKCYDKFSPRLSDEELVEDVGHVEALLLSNDPFSGYWFDQYTCVSHQHWLNRTNVCNRKRLQEIFEKYVATCDAMRLFLSSVFEVLADQCMPYSPDPYSIIINRNNEVLCGEDRKTALIPRGLVSQTQESSNELFFKALFSDDVVRPLADLYCPEVAKTLKEKDFFYYGMCMFFDKKLPVTDCSFVFGEHVFKIFCRYNRLKNISGKSCAGFSDVQELLKLKKTVQKMRKILLSEKVSCFIRADSPALSNLPRGSAARKLMVKKLEVETEKDREFLDVVRNKSKVLQEKIDALFKEFNDRYLDHNYRLPASIGEEEGKKILEEIEP